MAETQILPAIAKESRPSRSHVTLTRRACYVVGFAFPTKSEPDVITHSWGTYGW